MERIESQLQSGSFYNKEMTADSSNIFDDSYPLSSEFAVNQQLAYEVWSFKTLDWELYNKKLVSDEQVCYIDFTHPASPYPCKFLVFIGPRKLRKKSPIIPVGVFSSLSKANNFKEEYYKRKYFTRIVEDTSEMTKEYILWYNSKFRCSDERN